MKLMKSAVAGAVSIFVLVASASADLVGGDEFNLLAEGTLSDTPGVFTLLDANPLDQTEGLGITAVNLRFPLPSRLDDSVHGYFLLTGDTTDDRIFGSLSGTLSSARETETIAEGDFSIMSTTGTFSGWQGSGTFQITLDRATNEAQAQFGGMIVPSPGAFALFALAGLIGLRRRRSQ